MSNDLGVDRSGNGNNWTVNNLTYADQMLDVPTNNFATMNPLDSGVTSLAEGNLSITTDGNNNGSIRSTMSFPSGKWYTEVLLKAVAGGTQPYHWGIGKQTASITSWVSGGDYAIMEDDGSMKTDGSNVSPTYNDGGFSVGDIIGIAVDVDNNQITFFKNNTSLGAHSYTIEPNEYLLYIGDGSTVRSGVTIANFGQDSSFAGNKTAAGNTDGNGIGDFAYAPPSGFLALCTKNLPEPTVDPRNHFNTITYSGTGSTQSITVGFQPDLTWFKSRSAARAHVLVDSVRGVTKELISDTTGVELTSSATEDLTAFTSTGFDLGTVYNNSPNESGASIVSWNWKAGNANTAFSESGNNPAGTHRANVAAGFSIVSYVGTGAAGTVAHGLGVAPELMLIKNRDVNDPWAVYYGDNTDYLVLNENAATADAATYWNDTSPTATVFTVGTAHNVNADAENYIAYCWRSIDGFSKVGTYTGNGNADGTFIWTGFRPAYVMIKPSSRGGHWFIANNKSSPSNVIDKVIFANDSAAEYTDPNADCKKDFFSNGFKIRTTDDNTNENNATYTYLAFAETPFKYSNAR